ncbi:MAG: galactokinase [Polyangiaceae bacterium]|nr:galactokinase [Polyangiaceae bacterium]
MSFRSLFGRDPDVTASAPGRVNLIGEHTDYNGGFVLPAPIPQATFVMLGRRLDRTIRACSENIKNAAIYEYELGSEAKGGGFLDYVMGVTQALSRAGFVIGGADILVRSDVPLGAGLSSSAALEVSLLRAFRAAFSLDLGDIQIALLSQRAENDLVGAPVGIMDPMASSLAVPGTALFLDTRSLEKRLLPMPRGADLIVVSSGVTHDHAAGDYKTRRAECERAAALLNVSLLREVLSADLGRIEALPHPLKQRARHVVTENDRVLAAVSAMEAEDITRLGQLFYASHQSMRDDFEVSIAEIDALVDIARGDPDIFGARLTGGGFGGSVVMLAKRGAAAAAASRIAALYSQKTGKTPSILVPPGGRC